jgi:LmbE family N-acetylglucosaminyl deacetylase
LKKAILVFTPHPDDETLGAGGFLLKKKAEGYQLIWLILTNVKEEYGWSGERVVVRNQEISIVKDLYPFDLVFNLELKPTGLDTYSSTELMSLVEPILKELQPEIVLIPSANDPHTDHQVAHRLAISVTKKFRNPWIKMILEMEILSESNFSEVESISPNYFVDISDFLERKIEILETFSSELGDHPFPRSIESVRALAILRGTQAGCNYAEAFKIVKVFG